MEVFVLDLNELRPRTEEALALLSPVRLAKALRIARELPRLQSVGAGLLLRYFFGPADPVIAPGGKPYYPGGRVFSLTHSGTLAAIALSEDEAGLDAEGVRAPRKAVLDRVLTAEELGWQESRSGEGFAFLWTRKEAALKCLGVGADRPLSSFSVLEDAVVLDGKLMRLHTVNYKDFMISAAAPGDAGFAPAVITADELIRMDRHGT